MGISILLFFTATGHAQYREVFGNSVNVVNNEFAQHGDSILVNMKFYFDHMKIRKGQRLDIVPVLNGKNRTVTLPRVSVYGRRKYKEYERTKFFGGKKIYEEYGVFKGFGHSGGLSGDLVYHYVLPFSDWLSESRLNMRMELYRCWNLPLDTELREIADSLTLEVVVEPYEIMPHLAYMKAETEEVKHREVTSESFLDFAVGKTDIRPEFGNNPSELAKVRKMVEQVRSERGVTITGIDITGYASPEGSLASNQRLSEGRALSLLNYLRNRYPEISRELYHIHFGGEDWDGLVKLVKASQMSGKEEVLAIIEHVGILEGRERRLMDFRGGAPYRYMLREMFPSLRRVFCKVNYAVKNFDVEEAKEVIKTRPQNLSLNEMYMVANTYDPGSQEFGDVFETAVKLYPEDIAANVNAAVASLSRMDTLSARRYLERIEVKIYIPEYDNARGVLEMLQGNYDRAEGYFRAASEAGLEAASQNLGEIARKKENMELLEKRKR